MNTETIKILMFVGGVFMYVYALYSNDADFRVFISALGGAFTMAGALYHNTPKQ